MKHLCNIIRNILFCCIILATATSCVDVEEYSDAPAGNFEALWSIMDEHYCFFPEKEQQLGVNWSRIHSDYGAQVNSKMTDYQLFEFLSGMLSTLQDGHINLYSTFDTSRSWQWKEDYPKNFSDSIQRAYLGKSTEYKSVNGIYYRKFDDNIGYVYVGTFQNAIGSGALDEILYYLADCNGLIIDIRNNGGGQLTSAEALAARFANSKTLVGYIRHKSGTGHTDFSDYETQYIEPASGIRWNKKVCVLTNRSVFSAANEFTKYMKALGATIIGDTTGGGGGMPFSSQLPNGWTIRFSACPTFDKNKKCIEFGLDPDVKVDITSSDYQKSIDTIIETARRSF